jgi:hypothetical protein
MHLRKNSLHPGAPEPHPRKFECRRSRRRSSLLPKIKLCRLDRIRRRLLRCLILCGFVAFAKPCPRRLNDQGLLDSYGVYRSPWISCSFARHLVIERYPRTGGGEDTKRQAAASIPFNPRNCCTAGDTSRPASRFLFGRGLSLPNTYCLVGDVPTKVRKTPRDLAQTRIYTTRRSFSRLPKSDCFQTANFGGLIPTES